MQSLESQQLPMPAGFKRDSARWENEFIIKGIVPLAKDLDSVPSPHMAAHTHL